MIVEKVFSNTEDPEENLYSVLMTEEEMRMFAVNPVKNFFRKTIRNIKYNTQGFKTGVKGFMNKEMNPADVQHAYVTARLGARQFRNGSSAAARLFRKTLSPEQINVANKAMKKEVTHLGSLNRLVNRTGENVPADLVYQL